jgi:hypothetical protein
MNFPGKTLRQYMQTVNYFKNAIFWDVAAATCSRWFLACGFFYPEDGVDTFV